MRRLWLQAPRTWGWTASDHRGVLRTYAGPTHVGMDRTTNPIPRGIDSRPHARGDGPITSAPTPSRSPQAPRTWGWTGPGGMVSMIEVAGPTHVGMDRSSASGGA